MQHRAARIRHEQQVEQQNARWRTERQIGLWLEITALGVVSQAPVSGEFIIGSVLVTQDNAETFYYPDSPF